MEKFPQDLFRKIANLSRKQKVMAIIILIISLLLLVFLGKKSLLKPPGTAPASEISPTPTPILVKPIIKEILDYIETQRLNDGFYNYLAHYNEQCEMKEGEMVCPYQGEWTFPQTNAWTSLAYLSGYQVLGEQKYLDLAKRDMDRLILHCESKPEDCLWVLVQAGKLYQETGDSHYLDFLKKEGGMLLGTQSSSQELLLDIEIRELAILYGVTGDSRYLEEAQKRLKLSEDNFNQREFLYKTEEQFLYPQKACWQTLAKIELGKQTEDKTYFEEVKAFLDKAKVMANFERFPHPIEIQPCMETYFELAKATGGRKYYQEGRNLLEKFVTTFWDGKDAKLIYGEGGTIFNPYPARLTYAQKYVVLTDGSYSLYLLSYLEEE